MMSGGSLVIFLARYVAMIGYPYFQFPFGTRPAS